MPRPKEVQTAIVTQATGNVASGQAHIHWLSITNNHSFVVATTEINDSTDDSGTDIFQVAVGLGNDSKPYYFARFDPPMKVVNGIFVDIAASSLMIVTIGYTT